MQTGKLLKLHIVSDFISNLLIFVLNHYKN